MKYFSTFALFTGTVLALSAFNQPATAKDKISDTTIYDSAGTAVSLEPNEEARKLRQLAKLALANNAPAVSREVLSAEIALVEKDRKFKEKVVARLLQDDNPDPTLPSVQLVKYKDGSVRGLLFVQTDDVKNNNPNRLAWPLDAKRERKEETR